MKPCAVVFVWVYVTVMYIYNILQITYCVGVMVPVSQNLLTLRYNLRGI